MILVGLCIGQNVMAQLVMDKPDFRYVWSYGVVIDDEQEVHRGQVMLNYEENLVMIKQGEITTTLAPNQTTYVQFYDEELGINREFIPLVRVRNLRIPAFFEVVVKGNLVLLRREVMYDNPTKTNDENGVTMTITPVVRHEYYLYNHDRLQSLVSYRRDLLPFIRSRKQDIDSFVRDNKLQVAVITDQIEIIHYYNSLED